MRASVLLVVLAALGCTPVVNTTPGFYSCATDDDCPNVSPACVAMRCHPRLDAGTVDGGAIDAGTSDAGADAAVDAGADDAGIDSGTDAGRDGGMPPPPDGGPPPCTANAECGGGLCIAGGCRRACTSDAECGLPGIECLGADAAGMHANVCLPRDLATAEPYYRACAASECPAPFDCIEGHCMRGCEPGMLCLPEELCVRSAPASMGGEMRLVCVELCADGSCPGDGRCAPPPPGAGSTNVCLVWGGAPPP